MSMNMNDVKGIMQDEMGICLHCHDHLPCGCDPDVDEKWIAKNSFDAIDEKRRSEGE